MNLLKKRTDLNELLWSVCESFGNWSNRVKMSLEKKEINLTSGQISWSSALKDTHREKSTLKLKYSTHEKYEYWHLSLGISN